MNIKSLQQEIDYYIHFQPTNFLEEKNKFIEAVTHQSVYNPQFHYGKHFSEDTLKLLSAYLKTYDQTDPVVHAFIDIYKQVILFIKAWQKDDYNSLTELSGIFSGSYQLLDVEEAIRLYNILEKQYPLRTKYYTVEEVRTLLLKELEKNNLKNWEVTYSEKNSSEVSIFTTRKLIQLRPHHTYSEIDVRRILIHEIEGHAFQTLNALTHPKYADFLSCYLGTEQQYEGLAIFTEINKLPKSIVAQGIKRYLCFMIAIHRGTRGSFHDVYQTIFTLTKNKDFSFRAAYRAKFGFRDTSHYGSQQIDNSYLMGAFKIIRLVKENKETYHKLIQGKFSFPMLPLTTVQNPSYIAITSYNNNRMTSFSKLLQPVIHDE